MKAIILVLFLFCGLSTIVQADPPRSHKPIALVWDDVGTCAEGCARAAGRAARKAGFEPVRVNLSTLTREMLASAAVWVQPGGDGVQAATAMGPEKLALIRDFVSMGGRYVGFCAGAFLADEIVDDAGLVHGLGITPVTTADYAKDTIGKSDAIVSVDWNGEMRKMYFSEGATILPTSRNLPLVKVFASYVADGNRFPAAWENAFGNGYVVVAGMHPEAPDSWKENVENTEDTDGDDIQFAIEMFDRAFQRAPEGKRQHVFR